MNTLYYYGAETAALGNLSERCSVGRGGDFLPKPDLGH